MNGGLNIGKSKTISRICPEEKIIRLVIMSLIPRRKRGPEDKINKARLAKILVLIDSSHSQLLINAKIITNGPILMPFGDMFSFPTYPSDHFFSGVIELVRKMVNITDIKTCPRVD